MNNNDWTGNQKSVYTTLGASNHTEDNREVNDYYATDPKATEFLLQLEKFDNHIFEPACGEGHISEILKENGYNVVSSDLIDRGYGQKFFDFLTYKPKKLLCCDIITNPPYKYAKEFVEHSLEIIETGHKVAMFLKVQFLEGKARKELFKKYPPKKIWVSSSRLLCAKNGDFEKMKLSGGSAVAYAWYIWEKGYNGQTAIDWFN